MARFEQELQQRRPGLLRNIREEARLVGDGAFDDSTEMASFLRGLASAFMAPVKDPRPEADEVFVATCGQHELKGLKIPRNRLPEVLWRFLSNRLLLKDMLQATCDAARLNLLDQSDSLEEVFSLLAEKWSANAVTQQMLNLSWKEFVFATFDPTPMGVLTRFPQKASEIRAALALGSGSGDDLLYQLAYKTDLVEDYRFPTVADANCNERFQPAPDASPDPANPRSWWGWTAPDQNRAGLPEIVHKNASLGVLDKAPQLCKR